MMLNPHEVIRHTASDVGVKLTGDGGTKIRANCRVLVTNQNIRIESPNTVTYTVPGKGDRNFNNTHIPLLAARPHRFIQPWFGPYRWETLVSSPTLAEIETLEHWTLELTFSSGGAFEYRQAFLKVYADAAQAAQEGLDEVLPAYSA